MILEQLNINFTKNCDRDGNTAMFFIVEETKKTLLEFSKWNSKSLVNVL